MLLNAYYDETSQNTTHFEAERDILRQKARYLHRIDFSYSETLFHK